MICVIATIELLPGCRENFLAALERLAPQVRAEPGCLEYAPMLDLATNVVDQTPREQVVTMVEKWGSVEALRAHLSAPHMAEFRKATAAWRRSTTLRILRPA